MLPRQTAPLAPVALGFALATATAPLSGQTPVGEPFQMNQHTPDAQTVARVASPRDGGFAAVWSSQDQDGDSFGIYGRWYDADCEPITDEMQLNQHTTGSQFGPIIGADDDGRFVVAWRSSSQGVMARRFQGSSPLGDEFVVEPETADPTGRAGLSVTPEGSFLVSWMTNDGTSRTVWTRIYDSAGNATTPRVEITDMATNQTEVPSAGLAPNGDYFVTWEQQSTDSEVWGRKFVAAQGEFEVAFEVGPPLSGYWAYNPLVVADEQNNFRVLWQEHVHLERADMVSRSVGAAGLGLRTVLAQDGFGSALDLMPDGDFVVAWGLDDYAYTMEGRLGSSDNELEPPFEVATSTTNPYLIPSGLAIRGPDPREFVVSWTESTVESERDVYARCFSRLFADGFESGDTSAWTTTVP